MAIAPKLALRQSQSLVMTPQLSQSIKLLAMSNIELASYVEGEIERNPFLEQDSENSPEAPDLSKINETADTSALPERISGQEKVTSVKEMSDEFGSNLENVDQDDPSFAPGKSSNSTSAGDQEAYVSRSGLSMSGSSQAHDSNVADFTAKPASLRDHLLSQLMISGAAETTNGIAKILIDNLDESGYLRTDSAELIDRLGTDEDQLEGAVQLVQSLEPTGVGARSLEECLTLQLKERNRFDPAMEALVSNLELLARREFDTLQQLSGLSLEDLNEALQEIRALDPKPGTAFETVGLQQVVPDVVVKESAAGTWHIELNAETLPRVLVDQEYVAEVSNKISDKSSAEYVNECLSTANWLTRSLDQRAQTILKVSKEIVKQQDAFLAFGVSYLKPLTLKQVAEQIDMHESSVSRVTSNKYMMTPRGLFELKYFFTTSISGTQGSEAHSAEAVRDQIQKLIAAETASTVLSDDAIVDALKLRGIDIARRTIAKYREAMHIPSSVQRRREKKLSDLVSS